jgi:hypothetical protein
MDAPLICDCCDPLPANVVITFPDVRDIFRGLTAKEIALAQAQCQQNARDFPLLPQLVIEAPS